MLDVTITMDLGDFDNVERRKDVYWEEIAFGLGYAIEGEMRVEVNEDLGTITARMMVDCDDADELAQLLRGWHNTFFTIR